MSLISMIPNELLFVICEMSGNITSLRSVNGDLRAKLKHFLLMQVDGIVTRRPVDSWRISTGTSFFTQQHITITRSNDASFSVSFFFVVDLFNNLRLSSISVCYNNHANSRFDRWMHENNDFCLDGVVSIKSFFQRYSGETKQTIFGLLQNLELGND